MLDVKRRQAAARAALLGAFFFLGGALASAASLTKTFRGRLTDATGTPLSGTYLLRFALWDDPQEGAQVWSESIYVAAREGLFTAAMGRVNPLPARVLAGGHRLEAAGPSGTGWQVSALSAPEPETVSRPAAAPVVPAPAPIQASRPEPAPVDMTALRDLKRELEAVKEELRRAGSGPPLVYTVAPGDTLKSVARKLYGDPERWIELYQANDDRIQRGGDLTPGQKLVVPREGRAR